MERVSGIGGVFLRARDPAALAAWYAEHLGLDVEDVERSRAPLGRRRDARLGARSRRTPSTSAGSTSRRWSTTASSDLDAMLAQLRAAGVAVEGPMEHENGRFGWGVDPEGNRFELWQPSPGD